MTLKQKIIYVNDDGTKWQNYVTQGNNWSEAVRCTYKYSKDSIMIDELFLPDYHQFDKWSVLSEIFQ